MTEVGSAYVTLLPSAKGFGTATERQVGGEMKTSGGRLGKVMGGAMALAGGAALGAGFAAVGFLKDAVGQARESNQVAALTNSVIKATGGAANVSAKQVANLSGALSMKTGIDDEVIQSGENMLLTFKNVRNEAGKGNDVFNQSTKTLIDMSSALGEDPKNAAIQLGKALNDPVKGISALSRVGVTFDDQQKKTIQTMVASGNTMGAQKIILKELNSEFGGAAAAQATNSKKFQVAYGNMKESIGNLLIPAIDSLMGALIPVANYIGANLGPAMQRLGRFIAPAVAGFKNFFSSLGGGKGGGAFSAFGNAVKLVLPNVLKLAQTIGSKLGPVFAQVANIIGTKVVPIVATFAKFFYSKIVPAVVKVAQQVGQNLKPAFNQLVKTFQSQVLPALSKLLTKFHQWQPTIQAVIRVVVQIIGKLIVFQSAILGKVLPVVIKLAGFLISVLIKAMIRSGSSIINVVGKAIAFGRAMIEAGQKVSQFASTVGKRVSAAVGFIGSLPSKAKAALGNLGSLLLNAGEDLIQGLINGIENKLSALRSKLSEVTHLLPKWKGPPSTDAKLLVNNGRLIMGGLITGIESRKGDLRSSLSGITTDIGNAHVGPVTSGVGGLSHPALVAAIKQAIYEGSYAGTSDGVSGAAETAGMRGRARA